MMMMMKKNNWELLLSLALIYLTMQMILSLTMMKTKMRKKKRKKKRKNNRVLQRSKGLIRLMILNQINISLYPYGEGLSKNIWCTCYINGHSQHHC
jgi:hypothetical protein